MIDTLPAWLAVPAIITLWSTWAALKARDYFSG